MAKGDYGHYSEDELYRAFRKGHQQHCAYMFGRRLADRVHRYTIDIEDVDRRIEKVCEKNPKWKKEFVQYAFDKTHEFNQTYGTPWEPIYGYDKYRLQ